MTKCRDATHVQRTTDKLKEIKHRYQELYDNHVDGIVETDIEGNFVDCNTAYARMLGYAREELIGRNYREVTPEGWHEWEDRLVEEQIVATGSSGIYEKEYVRKDGTVFPVELNSYLISDAEGNPTGMWAFARDITERKRVEVALRESEARLANLMQAVPLAIQGYELDGTVWYWNRASEWIYGYSAEEAIGKKLDELIIPEAIQPMYRQGLEAAKDITQSGEFLPAGEVRLRRKDGSSVVVHSIHTAACVEGLPPMLFCIDMDLSERRRAEETLRESEGKYRQVVENANESILVAQNGKLLFCNGKTEQLSGYTVEELLRLPFADLIHREDREMVAERHARRMAGEDFENVYPFRIRRKDGETRWVQINAVRIEWQGEPATLNFLIDITEQRDMEQKLMHQMEQAEKLNQFMVGREKRVIEMKREVNALLRELGREQKYGV